jgi:uncharacterized glyoxalase superfamily protein PhnB
MLDHANLTITAWDGEKLIGVSRALTDFSFCCYLSDLAVDESYQRSGIGRELIRCTREEAGLECVLLLLSAPPRWSTIPKLVLKNWRTRLRSSARDKTQRRSMSATPMTKTHIILYVHDQTRSAEFYSRVFDCEPTLNVPGMTEFPLSESCTLGLMPEAGIKRLLGDLLPDPARGNGIPRAEIYLRVENAAAFHRRSIEAGATELSPLADRDWGDRVAYSLDLDGHVLAFVEQGE